MSSRQDIVCEFCGMTYPADPSNPGHPLGYPYYQLTVRNVLPDRMHEGFKQHTICKDCYDRLKEI